MCQHPTAADPSTGTGTASDDLDRLEALASDLGVIDLDLDEEVHEQKAREASEVNNGGRRAQLQYLLGSWGAPAVEDRLRAI